MSYSHIVGTTFLADFTDIISPRLSTSIQYVENYLVVVTHRGSVYTILAYSYVDARPLCVYAFLYPLYGRLREVYVM